MRILGILLISLLVFILYLPAMAYSFPEGNFDEVGMSTISYDIIVRLDSDGSVYFSSKTDVEILGELGTNPYWLLGINFGNLSLDYDTFEITDIQNEINFKRVSKLNHTDCSDTFQIDYSDKAVYICIKKSEDRRVYYQIKYVVRPNYPRDIIKEGKVEREFNITAPKSKNLYHIGIKNVFSDELIIGDYRGYCTDGMRPFKGKDYITCEIDNLNSSNVETIAIVLKGIQKSYIETENLRIENDALAGKIKDLEQKNEELQADLENTLPWYFQLIIIPLCIGIGVTIASQYYIRRIKLKITLNVGVQKIDDSTTAKMIRITCTNDGKRPVTITSMGARLPNDMNLFFGMDFPDKLPMKLEDGDSCARALYLEEASRIIISEGFEEEIKLKGFVQTPGGKEYESKEKFEFNPREWVPDETTE